MNFVDLLALFKIKVNDFFQQSPIHKIDFLNY